jgi:pimeloyl-ACP methyl ester carboxylesterase
MASTSSDKVAPAHRDIFVPTHDGTILVLRKRAGGKSGVLIIPDDAQHIDAAFLEQLSLLLADKRRTTFLLEQRGHGMSEGRWAPHEHRADLLHIVSLVRRTYPHLFVIAFGANASVLLELEQRLSVDGMVLVYQGGRFLRRAELPAARVQTPTVLFAAHDAARRVSGDVRLVAAWDAPRSTVENTARILQLRGALDDLAAQERPIRFATAAR